MKNSRRIVVMVEEETKKQFEQSLEKMGVTVSVAINMFVKSVIRTQGIPFRVTADEFIGLNYKERKEIKDILNERNIVAESPTTEWISNEKAKEIFRPANRVEKVQQCR